jgi:hypothetical protein
VARMTLPIQEAVRDLTGDLLDRGTAVDKSDQPLAPGDIVAVGAYRSDDGVLQAAVAADRALVPILGGALVLVPEVAIHEIQRLGDIPGNIFENYWEVANVFASLLNGERGPHVVLTDRHESWDATAPEIQELVAAPVRQRWFTVTVTGYGTGRMGFVAAT